MKCGTLTIAVLVGLLEDPSLFAGENGPAAAQPVLGLFQTRCVKCHAGKQPKAHLDLTSLDALSGGSRAGAVVVPGKLGESLLWQVVHEDRMPPKEPLPKAEKLVLRRWIEQGAPGLGPFRPGHALFRAPVRPAIPMVRDAGELRTPIDHFIAAALAAKGLTLNAEAERATLIRRVSFDLTGLPPTPADIDAFLADRSPNAYERMVDRYLASPHYGERWGKYWLDAAGYADSNGYFDADSDRPLAYRYRDYVVRAVNEDKPYDRFVQEQLAGDTLAGYVPDGDITPAMVELLVATHFLRNAPDGTGESDGNPDEVRTDRFTVLEGTLQVTMNCLLGLTIQCARCHTHKFEPISHEEYYRLQAIFYTAYCPDRWIVPKDRVVSVASRVQREEHRRRTERVDRQTKALQAGLEAFAEPLREELIEERLPPLEPGLRSAVLQAVATSKVKRTPAQQELIKTQVEPLKIADDELARRFPEFAAYRECVQQTIAARQKERPPPLDQLAVLVENNARPAPAHVLVRGQHNAPGPEVQPGVPAALSTPANSYRLEPPRPGIGSSRRLAFARWVTAPDNPLFARVLVNRLWQHHFGMGLVATPDNLGQSGAPPSHPELLDYLATEFIHTGLSIKAMHRLILCSAVYRQASTPRADAIRLDPDNRLLSRFPLRRLDAEALRDAMLAVAGDLDQRMGGPYVPVKRAAAGTVEVEATVDGARRRSLYLQQRRTGMATFLELFDLVPPTPTCSVRNLSTVPLQALALLNADFARRQAEGFARRLKREAGAGVDGRLALAFQLAAGRSPDAGENAAVQRFLDAQRALYAPEKDGEQRAWVDLCHMILAGNAFLYVE
jgi:hypothetical protein